MIRKSLSLGTRAAITIAILLLIGAGSFLLWAMETPRSLPALGRYIERSLNSLSADYRVQIGQTLLLWDQQERRFDIRASNMELRTVSGQLVGSVPEVSMRFSALNLLNGLFIPSSMTVISPVIQLHTTTNPLSPEELQKLYTRIWQKATSLARLSNAALFKDLVLRNAKLIIDTPESTVLWTVKQASITAAMQGEIPEIVLKADMDFAGELASLSLGATFSDEGVGHISISTENFPLHKPLVLLAPSQVIMPLLAKANLHMLLTANAMLQVGGDGALQNADISIKDLHGRFFYPEYMERRIEAQHFKGKATWVTEGESHASLELSGHFPDEISAHIAVSCQPPFTAPECHVNAEVEKFPVDTLAAFWPARLASPARHWVTTNITKGMVTKAIGSFIFKPEYFKEHSFPKEAINATLYLHDVQLQYMPSLPIIEHINGIVKFDNTALDIAINKGAKMLNTVIDKAHVVVPYINMQGKAITVDVEGKGSASDLLAFFPVDRIAENGLNLKALIGKADSRVKLVIPYKPQLTFYDVGLALNSTLQDIEVPGIFPRINASDGRLKATIQAHHMTLSGELRLNGNPSRLNSKISLKEKEHFASESVLDTVLLPKDMALADTMDVPRIEEGAVITQLRIAAKPKSVTVSGTLNPTGATVAWDKFGVRKAKGEKALLTFDSVINDKGVLSLPAFSYNAVAVKAEGSASFAKDHTLEALDLKRLISDHTNIILYYRPQPQGGHLIDIKGDSLDLRTIDFHQLFKQSTKENSLSMKASLKRILMKNEEVFTDFKGRVECINSICQTAKLASTIRDKDSLNLSLTPRNGQRMVSITSTNAAAVARAFNISRNIRGGALAINAVSSKNENAFYGNMQITNLVTINNPFMSEVIAVVSLPGIGLVNLLRGEGIAFDRLDVPFTFSNGIITLYNARATGPVLGIISNGTINMKEATFDLYGTVAPTVYGINNLVSKIPVIGDALMGRRSQGIIAANYRVEGPVQNAAIDVNPLSILTPGFLRDIFGR